jgi:hypothetical protein
VAGLLCKKNKVNGEMMTLPAMIATATASDSVGDITVASKGMPTAA